MSVQARVVCIGIDKGLGMLKLGDSTCINTVLTRYNVVCPLVSQATPSLRRVWLARLVCPPALSTVHHL